jgi:phage tail-like protein
MATPQNLRSLETPDPLLGYRFILLLEGRAVAGLSKVGALSRKTEVIPWSTDAGPLIPGQISYEPVLLERGLVIDGTFDTWANKVCFLEATGSHGQIASLADFRRDLVIQLMNQAGQLRASYLIFNCWPSDYMAMPEADASANTVALQSMTLQNEGWQRDATLAAPEPPSFKHPD